MDRPDRGGLKWTEADQMDQIIRWIGPNGLNRPKWTEQDRIDRIGPKKTEVDRMDRIEQN